MIRYNDTFKISALQIAILKIAKLKSEYILEVYDMLTARISISITWITIIEIPVWEV